MKHLLLLLFAACLSSSLVAQRINPKTQIKGPVNAGADSILVTNSDNNLEYRPITYLNGKLLDEVTQSTSNPSGAPSSTQGNLHINTSNGTVWVYSGGAWTQVGTIVSASNGLTKSGTNVKLGGQLTENTIVKGGAGVYNFELDSMNLARIRTRGNAGTATSTFTMTTTSSAGASLQTNQTAVPGVFSRVWVNGTQSMLHTDSSVTRGFARTGFNYGQIAYATLSGEAETVVRDFQVSDAGHYLSGLDSADASSFSQAVYLNPTTGEIGRKAPPNPAVSTLNAQSGTTYTFVLADAGKLATFTNGSAVTATVPPSSSIAYDVGTHIDLVQLGAGQVTVAPGSGVTINGASGLKTRVQYSAATLIKVGTDSWILIGDTTN